jgi:hypothetical protein
MANYKFPTYNTVFIDPTISMYGHAGTKIDMNVPEDVAYCDLLIETPQTKDSAFRLEGSPKPVDWTVESLSLWVAEHLVQYEIEI